MKSNIITMLGLKKLNPQKFKLQDDVSKQERGVRDLRKKNPFTEECAESMCSFLEHILWRVFRSLYGSSHSFDGISLEKQSVTEKKISLSGTAFWLAYEEDFTAYKADVAKNTQKLLFSFKFYNSKTMKQNMYIAKTPEGWVVDRKCIDI